MPDNTVNAWDELVAAGDLAKARRRDSVTDAGVRVTALDPRTIFATTSGAAGTGADWMGPQNPMSPVAPPEVKGRQLDYPVGYNLEILPKVYEGVPFAELRGMADAHVTCRLVIETRKDQLGRMSWGIKAKVGPDGAPMETSKANAAEITALLQKPDRRRTWGNWLRMVLEDLLVIDAASIYARPTLGGKLYALELIDGATIKRVIDAYGHSPEAPAPAYQQVLKGLPAVNYTVDELLYAPRNERTSRLYGFSPVEQVLLYLNIALRRDIYLLQWFTEGNMPEGLVTAPKDWTAEQIKDFQDRWDAKTQGNTAERRKVMVVPGDVGKVFSPFKEPVLTGPIDEWLARVICFAFSISAEPFVSKMNRATAETAYDAAIAEGLAPLMEWVKQLVDGVIEKWWPGSNLEFGWDDDREIDALQQQTVLTGYAEDGILTINEAREKLGQEPVPEGGLLRVKTSTGYVKIDANDVTPEPASPTSVAPAPNGEAQTQTQTEPTDTGKGAPAAKKAAAPFRKGQWWSPLRKTAPRRDDARQPEGSER